MSAAVVEFLRRQQAGEYLKTKYGFGSCKSLAKLATLGGGPVFRKASKAVLYQAAELDKWALAQIGEPQLSTSDSPRPASKCGRPPKFIQPPKREAI